MRQKLLHISQLSRQLEQNNILSAARLSVLELLSEGAVTVNYLARQRKVSMPTMSKLIDELQHQGLVLRAQAKEDARKRLIILTHKGKQTLSQAKAVREQQWQKISAGLTAEEQNQLRRLLDRLAALLANEVKSGD